MSDIIKIKELNKKFGTKHVLKNINLNIKEGKITGILAPNGAGKTTLMKTICNLYKANTGDIVVNEIPVGYETKEFISFMPDDSHLFRWMKVKDAINYYKDMFRDFDTNRSNSLCELLKIDKNEDIKIMSKGMKERVLLMLTLSRNAKIFILDEPLGGIDIVAKDKILKAILEIFDGRQTMVVSTHLVKDVENILDEVIFMNDGEIIFSGNSEEIREQKGKSIENYYLEVFENV